MCGRDEHTVELVVLLSCHALEDVVVERCSAVAGATATSARPVQDHRFQPPTSLWISTRFLLRLLPGNGQTSGFGIRSGQR
jgi:hypothetical protein